MTIRAAGAGGVNPTAMHPSGGVEEHMPRRGCTHHTRGPIKHTCKGEHILTGCRLAPAQLHTSPSCWLVLHECTLCEQHAAEPTSNAVHRRSVQTRDHRALIHAVAQGKEKHSLLTYRRPRHFAAEPSHQQKQVQQWMFPAQKPGQTQTTCMQASPHREGHQHPHTTPRTHTHTLSGAA